jgi:hypothetical protein
MERESRSTYRRGRGEETAGNKSGIDEGEELLGGTVVSVGFGQRRKMTGGSHLSARGREEGWVTVRKWLLGCGLLAILGRKVPPEPSSIFILFSSFFFFFYFLISFVTFAIWLQTDSNNFVKFLNFKVSKWDSKKQVFKVK